MRHLGPPREFHPLAPHFRRRMTHLFRALSPTERAVMRVVPVLLAGRFRRPGFDREPPGLHLMPRRRRWGRACEAIDFPPPLSFAKGRPVIRSVLLIPNGETWNLVLYCPGEQQPDDQRRLNERVQMVRLALLRHAPKIELTVEYMPLSTERMFFAGLIAGDVPTLNDAPMDLVEVLRHAPTPLARALSLTLDGESPFERLRPGLALCSPERFAAAHSSDARLLGVVRQLSDQSNLDELLLASRVVRHASLQRLRRLPSDLRRSLSLELRRSILSSVVLPAFRATLDIIVSRAQVREARDGRTYTLEIDGQPLLTARALDSLRARALGETPQLCPPHAEWRRARALLEGRTRGVLFVVEPGFVKHLVFSLNKTRRLRARRMTAAECLRLALRLKATGAPFETVSKQGADPILAARLAQLATSTIAHPEIGMQSGKRLLLTRADGNIRDVPFLGALSRPRRLTLLPERSEWLSALRQPPSVRGRRAVHLLADAASPTTAHALFVDNGGCVFAEEVGRVFFNDWAERSRELLGTQNATLSISLSPAVASMTGRRESYLVDAVLLDVELDERGHALIEFNGEKFGSREALGWRALAETLFSHWPPRTRGRIDVRQVRFQRQPPDTSPLEILAIRSRVLRRLAGQVARLGRLLEAA